MQDADSDPLAASVRGKTSSRPIMPVVLDVLLAAVGGSMRHVAEPVGVGAITRPDSSTANCDEMQLSGTEAENRKIIYNFL